MGMGRGRCINVVLVAFLVLSCALPYTFATNHVVGDSQGWGFSTSYANWAGGKSFASGDTLVFNYQNGLHNVVPVSAAGYRSCRASSEDLAKAGSTGKDKFNLKRGTNYFICSTPGHCSAGMKLQVSAA